MVRIVPATAADIARVAADVRPEHRREIRDASGLDAAAAVRLSVADSRLVFAGRAFDETLFLVGVGRKPLLADAGSVWMLATPAIDDHPLEAADAIRELFAGVRDLTGFDRIEQFVPAWYAKGLKFLRWLGWREAERTTIRGVEHVRMTYGAGIP